MICTKNNFFAIYDTRNDGNSPVRNILSNLKKIKQFYKFKDSHDHNEFRFCAQFPSKDKIIGN